MSLYNTTGPSWYYSYCIYFIILTRTQNDLLWKRTIALTFYKYEERRVHGVPSFSSQETELSFLRLSSSLKWLLNKLWASFFVANYISQIYCLSQLG